MVEENPVDSKGWEEMLERELSADGSDLDAEVRLAQILLDNCNGQRLIGEREQR